MWCKLIGSLVIGFCCFSRLFKMYFRKLLKRGIGFNAPSVHVGYCIKYVEKTVVPKNCINTLNLPFFFNLFFILIGSRSNHAIHQCGVLISCCLLLTRPHTAFLDIMASSVRGMSRVCF